MAAPFNPKDATAMKVFSAFLLMFVAMRPAFATQRRWLLENRRTGK